MASVVYPAIVERGNECFGVYFPDLPGCVSVETTQQEVMLAAEEALNNYLATMREFDYPIPEPSSVDAIRPEEGSIEVARILVRAERPGKSVRVQITLEEGLLARIDRVASNRSGFLADAARRALAAG